MKKLSTTLALAALIGAASFSTPVEAKWYHSLGKHASKHASSAFSEGKKYAKKAYHSKHTHDAAKAIGGSALSIGEDYIRSKLGI